MTFSIILHLRVPQSLILNGLRTGIFTVCQAKKMWSPLERVILKRTVLLGENLGKSYCTLKDNSH